MLTCIHIPIYIIYTHIHINIHQWVLTCIHICIYVCLHMCVSMCMFMYVCMYLWGLERCNYILTDEVQSWSTNWLSQGLINELIKPWGRTTSCSSLASKVGHWTWSSCWSTLGLINSLINLSVVGFFEYMIWSSQGWLILFWLNQGHRQHVFSVKSEFGRGVWERSLHACMHACKQTN